MKKIWIECQKCGSIFWVFSDEVKSVYPKSSLNYQICSGCESKLDDRWMIIEYFEDLKSQIGLYFTIIKIIFYFIIGALIIYVLKKISNLFSFFFRFLKKDSLKKNIYLIFQTIMFIIISIFIGWFVIYLYFKWKFFVNIFPLFL